MGRPCLIQSNRDWIYFPLIVFCDTLGGCGPIAWWVQKSPAVVRQKALKPFEAPSGLFRMGRAARRRVVEKGLSERKRLQEADGVEEHNEHGDRRDVAHEGLPSCVEGGVGNVQFGFGAFGGHEPAGKEGNEDAA